MSTVERIRLYSQEALCSKREDAARRLMICADWLENDRVSEARALQNAEHILREEVRI